MPARLTVGQEGPSGLRAPWRRLALGGLAVLFLATAPASAVVLQPGDTVRAGGPGQVPRGTVLASRTGPIWSPFFYGELVAQVIQNDTGGLSFTYRFTLDPSSSAVIHRVATVDFSEVMTDVRYAFTAPGDVAPRVFSRSRGAGDTMTFSFADPGQMIPTGVGAGEASALLIIDTDAVGFTDDGLIFFFDGAADCAFGFSPVRGVPEPGTLAIALVAGLPLLGAARLRRWLRK